MRKIFILFSFILFSINFSKAQTHQNINIIAGEEGFANIAQQIKDYVTIKIIEKYVKNVNGQDEDKNILNKYFEKNTIENPFNYSDFADILDDNNFSNTRKSFGDKINSIKIKDFNREGFADRMIENINSELTESQKTACEFSYLKKELISEINSHINTVITYVFESGNSSNSSSVSNSDDQASEQTDNNQGDVAEKPSFFSFSNFNLFTLLGILLPLILFIILFNNKDIFYKKNELPKIDAEEIKQTTTSNQSVYNTTQMTMYDFEGLLNKSKVFLDFKEALEKIQKQSPVNTQQPFSSSNQTYIKDSVIDPIPSDVFFMKNPVENYFPDKFKSSTKENTIYKFFLKANKNEAEFEIHTQGVKIDEIISMVETLIKSGCNENNNPTNNTTNIKTINKGIVSLEGEKWVIKQKALISYE